MIRQATRIGDRAIRRCGQLLKQIEPSPKSLNATHILRQHHRAPTSLVTFVNSSFEKRLKHPCFPQPPDHSLVWRYMSLAKLLSLLAKGGLYMTRIDQLEDRHEGANPASIVRIVKAQFEQLGKPEIAAQHSQMIKKQRERVYVNCWSLSDSESEALWRIFCSKDDGVAICAKYSSLVNAMRGDDRLYVGKVTYLDYERGSFPSTNIYYPIMHKRIPFAHEREVRMVKEPPEETPSPTGVTVGVDLISLVESIVVSPYAPNWYFSVVREAVSKFAPPLVPRVVASSMLIEPLY